jgi:hypothetical protein
MATLYITEYSQQGADTSAHTIPAALVPEVTVQALSISSTSAPSAAFNARTTIVRLQTDTACWVTFATSPVATASMTPLAPNTPEYFCVIAGNSVKVAAITA